MMLPVPKSPDDVNLIPSLDTPIEHVSPRTPGLINKNILFIKISRGARNLNKNER